MGKKREKLDIGMVELLDSKIIGVRLICAMFHCTCCGAFKPGLAFGLRVTDDRLARNQPHCIACRSVNKRRGRKIEKQIFQNHQLAFKEFSM